MCHGAKGSLGLGNTDKESKNTGFPRKRKVIGEKTSAVSTGHSQFKMNKLSEYISVKS